MKKPYFLILLLCSACSPHKYRVITATRNLPAGTVIQSSDIEKTDVAIADRLLGHDTDDPSRIIGHTAKDDLWKGLPIAPP